MSETRDVHLVIRFHPSATCWPGGVPVSPRTRTACQPGAQPHAREHESQLIPVISRKINFGVTIRAWNWSEESAQGADECLRGKWEARHRFYTYRRWAKGAQGVGCLQLSLNVVSWTWPSTLPGGASVEYCDLRPIFVVRCLAPGTEGSQLFRQEDISSPFAWGMSSLSLPSVRAEPFWSTLSWPLGPSQAGLVQGNDCTAWGLQPGEWAGPGHE